MKNIKMVLLAGIGLLSTTIGAAMGGSTGGGYVVFCLDPLTKASSVRLLDYYEAELLLPNLTLDLGNGNSELDLVENVLDRLGKIDADRANDYRQRVRGFLGDTLFVNVNLPDVKDYGFASLGDGCSLKQVAIQNLIPIPEGKKFTVSEPLWNKLSKRDRAGLMLHEIIYEEGLAAGHKDSRNSRFYNALVSSKEFSQLSASDYLARLKSVALPETRGGAYTPGIFFPTSNMTVSENRPFTINLAEYTLATHSDPLKFRKISGPSWGTISATGNLTGTPDATAIKNSNIFQFSITDGKNSTSGSVILRVVKGSAMPSLPMATAGKPFLYNMAHDWPLLTICEDLNVTKISGPTWLTVQNSTELAGTPTFLDAGFYTAIFEVTQTCDRIVKERFQDGTTIERKVKETQTGRSAYEGRVNAVVPKGTPLAKGEYEEVVILTGVNPKTGCQGTIVGPQVILTAGHCTAPASKSTFVFRNTLYAATFFANPSNRTDGTDTALGIVSQEIAGSEPLNIGGSFTAKDPLEVLAYQMPSATDLYAYVHKVVGPLNRYRITHQETSGQPSVGFGNSGAAVIVGKRFKALAAIVTAVGGLGGSEPQTVYSDRLDSPLNQAYFKSFAAKYKVDICGITKLCN